MQPSILHPDAISALMLSGEAPLRWTIVAKRTFDLSAGGSAIKAKKQIPLAGADIHTGEPENTPVKYESDFAPFKPVADVLCMGMAYPPGGAAEFCSVSFGIEPNIKTIAVFGDRDWESRLKGLAIGVSNPKPFESMAVSFENAYGGANLFDAEGGFDFYEQNRVGKGYARRGLRFSAMPLPIPLPNLEDPARLIRNIKDRPAPMGFGPVGRAWQPRLALAGTYDKKWLKHRSPLLPEDFNERYYNCAPQDQQVVGYLRGSEEVRVTNMHPEHKNLRCRLPGIRIRCVVERQSGAALEEAAMNLDTLFVDMEAMKMILVWRARMTRQWLTNSSRVLLAEEPLDKQLQVESYRAQFEAAKAAEQTEPEPDEAAPENTATEVAAPLDSETLE